MNTLSFEQISFLVIFLIVIYGWLFTKIPLFITGLIGVCASIFSGVISTKEALASFAHPLIFIFLGGYLFAEAITIQGLDKRISLKILSLKSVKNSPHRVFLFLFLITAFFSMWISNTATTAMMLPIVLSVLASMNIKDKKLESLALIGVAYSANIGGIATPIGSTPNILAIAMLKELANIEVSFLAWMAIALPLAILFLIILYIYISRFIPKEEIYLDSSFSEKQIFSLSQKDKNLITLFGMMVFFWFLPSLLSFVLDSNNAFYIAIKSRLHPGAVAIFFATLLFLSPIKKDPILLTESIKKIDWPSLLLFGAGLSLGKIVFSSGLASIAGDLLVQYVTGEGFFMSLIVLTFISIFATEVTSNTATANILLPIVIALAIGINANPLIIALAVAISCSLAFMLPVATPPNVIVYSSGEVDLKDMVKLGFILNVIYGLLMSGIFYVISRYIL